MTTPSMRAVFGSVQGITEAIREIEAPLSVQLLELHNEIGRLTIAFLQSYTSTTAPPVRPGDPPRRRHPGYWADRTGELRDSYGWEARVIKDGTTLELWNTAAHAAILERREGYYVLSGVADPGGPVEQALRAAVARLAPDLRVVSYD